MRAGRWLGLGLLLLTLLSLGFPAAAQPDNLLQNPGFEEPFVTIDPFGTVANAWIPWYVADGTAASSPFFGSAAPERVAEGESAQLFSSVFATAQAGVYQTVLVPTDSTLVFNISAYVWSSIDESDDNMSTVPGLVTMEVGIDPVGGTDPQSDAIIWSTPVEEYDAYSSLSVVGTAQGDLVTVFVRSTLGGDTYVSDIHLDAASLVVAGDSSAPLATEEPQIFVPTEDPVIVEVTLTVAALTAEAPISTDVPAPTEEMVAPTLEAPTAEAVVPTVDAPTEEPVATEETPIATEEAADAPVFLSEIEYVVQSGDNFYDIALTYNSTVEAILAANGLEVDTIIFPGDVLKIPVPVPPAPVVTEEPTTAEPTAEPTVEPTPEAIMTEEPRTEEVQRVVQRGDTLIGIAREYGMSEFDLAAYNNFTVMDVIRVGQVIRIPAPMVDDGAGGADSEVATATAEPTIEPTATPAYRRYVIVPGDTLSRIASRFGTTVRAILEINDIPNPNRILYGQVIRVPNE